MAAQAVCVAAGRCVAAHPCCCWTRTRPPPCSPCPATPAQDEEVRQSARAQFSALCAKLDALSHLHFT